MSCSDITPLLDDLVDGALSVAARARADAHLLECESCRALVADLRRIKETARGLPPATPPAHLWASIQLRLDQEDRAAKAPGRAAHPRPRLAWWPRWAVPALAGAAVVVFAVSAYVALRPSPGTPQLGTNLGTAPASVNAAGPNPAAHATKQKLVQSIETELQQADAHYEKAIAGLEQAAREGQSALDPAVAAVLQKNLAVTDQAIVESRAALKAEPTSEMAQASLFGALRAKVGLLQETVSLINAMRQGNQAAAASIVDKIGNKS